MDIYAIGDLHLPGGADKPMHVFGSHWEGHFDRIRRDWREKVREEGSRGSFLSKEKGLPEQSLINLFGDIRSKVPERSR